MRDARPLAHAHNPHLLCDQRKNLRLASPAPG